MDDARSGSAYSQYQNIQKSELNRNLLQIFSNLYYTWDRVLYPFIDKIDNYNWRKTMNPPSSISHYLEEKNSVQLDIDFRASVDGIKRQQEYLNDFTWYDEHIQGDPDVAKLYMNPIAYFSAEFGLVDWIQIYSGGLGMLAGDFIKQSSDHGLPVIGVGIFYHQGYFHQDINFENMQEEVYIPQDPASCLLKLVKDKDGNSVDIKVWVKDHEVYVRAWELNVGRTRILLLDTNYEKNTIWEDRMITAHLYGGTRDTRIRQEIVLGIGGLRFMKSLGIKPSILHMNEGHASFAAFEKAKEFTDEGVNFVEAIEKARSQILFTNHTLNPAGNDKFTKEIFKEYFAKYAEELKCNFEDLYALGSDKDFSPDQFAMTILGFKSSKIANAVSKVHGQAAQKIWPTYKMEAVTNGVHLPTWVAPPIQGFFNYYVDSEWDNPLSISDWKRIQNIPDADLWYTHKTLKRSAIEKINTSLGYNLDPEALTIVWTRRFAAYKRPEMILSDLERLYEIVNNSNFPVQLLVGGKAHPQDLLGKELLKSLLDVCNTPRFKNKISFLTGYNWNLARYLVTGADVWLNTPIRYEEACGTSGMKSGANGVLQFTTLDGWTNEVDWTNAGWILPQENIKTEIYRILEQEVIPTYYESELPKNWINRMKKTMEICCENYSSDRMLEDYVQIYKKLLS